MKVSHYTTFGKLPVGAVFRYVPDHGRIGPRVKVDTHLICTPEFYRSHKCNPPHDILNEASWSFVQGVHYCEENIRVRITPADDGLFDCNELMTSSSVSNNNSFKDDVI